MTDTYDEEIRFTDAVLGDVLDALESLGILDETILVVFSDHGEDFGDHRDVGRHGHQVYDSVTHVPLMIRWPAGGVTPRTVHDAVGLVDVAPTLLELLGLAVPPQFLGRSLVPLLRGEVSVAESPRFAISENLSVFRRTGIESDGFKLIVNDDWNRAKIDPSRITDVHAEVFGNRGVPVELYDLRVDPGERQNLVRSDDSGNGEASTPEAAARYDGLARLLEKVMERSEEVRASGPARGSLSEGGAGALILDKLNELGYMGEVGSNEEPGR